MDQDHDQDHDARVTQFVNIAGCSVTTAAQYLQVADDNIENALQLYYETGGVGLGHEETGPARPAASGDNSRHPATSSGIAEAVNVDSDDDDDVQEVGASTRTTGSRGQGAYDQDSEMARRLQEEMYSATGPQEVRAPMGRVTETLVGGPEDDYAAGAPYPANNSAAMFNQFRDAQYRNRSCE